VGGYVALIAAGTLLLLLPKAAADAMKPLTALDALFTSTSAACLCGLSVCDISTRLTTFGQIIVMMLMQLGAMGVMTFGVIVAFQARRALEGAAAEGEGLDDAAPRQALERMIRYGVLFIFIAEIIGSIASVSLWRQAEPEQPLAFAAYRGVFHTVSAFCNGGFDLQGVSLQHLAGHWQTLGILAPLMVLGGLGIPVLGDVAVWFRSRLVRKGTPPAPLPLFSKLVLTTTLLLIVAGAGGLMWIENASFPGYTFGAHYSEQDNAGVPCQGRGLVELPPDEQVSQALFQSISARSCGLATLDIDKFSDGGKLWTCLLMIVGGSPGGAAGGVKTIALAVLVLTVWSMIRRRQEVESFGRTIPQGTIRLAVTLTAAYLAAIVVLAIVLSVNMAGRRLLSNSLPPTFMQLFFETVSAVGEVGFSCNVTPSLTAAGRETIIVAMLLGRLGLPMLVWMLSGRLRPVRRTLPTEPLPLG
jgi:trk system potassium uptake protein